MSASNPIPLFKVYMAPEAGAAVLDTLYSGYLTQGPKVEAFEEALRRWLGYPFVLTVNSGTSALQLALTLAGVGFGDKVISTPMTCSATNTAIRAVGADIVWADIDPISGNIDPHSVADILGHPDNFGIVKAIMAVDWAGAPCNWETLRTLADFHEVQLIEDAAHAFGAEYKGQKLGAYADFTCYSFQAIKALTTGDGGALVCKRESDYKRGKLLRWFGIDRDGPRHDFRCLHPNTKLSLTNGSKIPINTIVNAQEPCEVVTIANGTLSSAKLVSWHTSSLGNRHFLEVNTVNLQQRQWSVLTNDHKVLTEHRGWQRVDCLVDGEAIATNTTAANDKQMQVIVGSLLGDGSIASTGAGRTGVLQENHTAVDAEYTILKAKALESLGVKVITMPPNLEQRRPNGTTGYYTTHTPFLGNLRKLWYPQNRKVVPFEQVRQWLTPLALATWYMDDGSVQVNSSRAGLRYAAQLATNSFTEAEVKALREILKTQGYETTQLNHGKTGWRIFFSTASTHALFKVIAPYITPCMRYKIAHDASLQAFNATLWETGPSKVHYEASIVRQYRGTTLTTPRAKVYCVTVDAKEANFSTSSIIVHNCEADIEESGFKYHMNDLNATIGLAQLNHTHDIVQANQYNAAFFDVQLRGLHGIRLIPRRRGEESAHWMYTLHVEQRKQFMDYMAAAGIVVSQVHARNDTHTMFNPYRRNLPGVEAFTTTQVSIPCGWWLTEDDRKYIVHTIKTFSEQA